MSILEGRWLQLNRLRFNKHKLVELDLSHTMHKETSNIKQLEKSLNLKTTRKQSD